MKGRVAVILRRATERQRRTEIEVLDTACLGRRGASRPHSFGVVGGMVVGQALADFKGQWLGHGCRLLVQHLSGCGCEDSFSRESNKSIRRL